MASGPLSGNLSVASGNFTVTPTSSVADTVSVVSSVGGDTITTSPLTFSSATPGTFTVTPSTLGPRTLTLTSSGGRTITGSPLTYTAAVPFTITGSATVAQGGPTTLTITPSTTTTDVVTLTDYRGGTFSPATLTFSASSVAQTSAYTPAVIGPITVSGYSTHDALFTPLSVTSIMLQVDGYVSTCGKTVYFMTNSAGATGNGNPIQGTITSVNTTPTIQVNGTAVQIGRAVSPFTDFLTYYMECGSLDAVNFSNAGTTSYTAPTLTATGVTFGTPVLASGVLGYAITAPGTGYTTSFITQVPIAGQTTTQLANAFVLVSGGVVQSVVPCTGSAISYGAGYTGTTHTGVSLPGSGALGISGGSSGNATWGQLGTVPGTGLTVTVTIGNYIQSCPILSSATGMTAPPAISISDSSGAGAVAVAVMSGPLSTDTITYSAPAGWLLATVGQETGFPAPAAVAASLGNWVGQLEGATGKIAGMQITPTMPAGANIGSSITPYPYNIYFTGKNKLEGR